MNTLSTPIWDAPLETWASVASYINVIAYAYEPLPPRPVTRTYCGLKSPEMRRSSVISKTGKFDAKLQLISDLTPHRVYHPPRLQLGAAVE
jgi:hypothetical protein